MKGIIVCDIPGKRKHKLQQFLDEFMKANVKHYEVLFDDGDYKSVYVARSCLGVATTRSKYPIKVVRRGDRVFLTRTDM